MTWADTIIILAATVLCMVTKRLDRQITYNCPPYCAVDHTHFCSMNLDCPSDQYRDCVKR